MKPPLFASPRVACREIFWAPRRCDFIDVMKVSKRGKILHRRPRKQQEGAEESSHCFSEGCCLSGTCATVVESLFLFSPSTLLPSSPRAAMTRHVAAAISLLAGIVFIGTELSAQVSRRLFEARRSGERGGKTETLLDSMDSKLTLRCRATSFPAPPRTALPRDIDSCTPENGTARTSARSQSPIRPL